jgi:hypothetical protein
MQALQLAGIFGWRWVGSGWRLFRRQPFSFAAMLLLCALALLCADALIDWLGQTLSPLIPTAAIDLLGGTLIAVVSPVLTIGFLQACRVAQSGLAVQPLLIFAGFRSGRPTLPRLLALGAIQTLALIVILLIISGPDAFRTEAPAATAAVSASSAATSSAATSSPSTSSASTSTVAGPAPATDSARLDPTVPLTEAEQAKMIHDTLAQLEHGAVYLPIAMITWYAPMLIAWHGLPIGKAVFFSLVAVWRNRAAFAIYGLAWIGVWFGLSMVFAMIAIALNLTNVLTVVAAPLAMLLVTWMYCSVYATYDTVFVDHAAASPAADDQVAG